VSNKHISKHNVTMQSKAREVRRKALRWGVEWVLA